MINSRSWRAPPGSGRALRPIWTWRLVLVTVPSFSGQADAGSTTSAYFAGSVRKLEFRVYWAWLRQRSLFDRGVYGSWRAVDVGFEPLVMRRRRSRAGLYHEQGRFSCGLRARGGKPGYRGTGGPARP